MRDAGGQSARSNGHVLFLLFVMMIGALVGLFVWAFLYVMNLGIDFIWNHLYPMSGLSLFPLIVCILGGAVIGLYAKRFGRLPPELSEVMGKIRKEKRYHYDDVGVSIVAALLPLLFGGCVGPEAGLTGSIAGLCTWAGDCMRIAGRELSELTEIGISATLGAIFGAPLFGFVAPLETEADSEEETVFPRRTKMLLNLVAIFGGLATFMLMNALTGGHEGLYRFDAIQIREGELIWLVPLVLVGIVCGLLYRGFGWLTARLATSFGDRPVEKAVICGLVLGSLGILLPFVMFAGESQMELLAEDWQSIPVLILLSTGLVKLFMGPFCINFGWRGGNIFPVIFSGVAIGFASATLIGIDSVFCVCVVTSTLCGMVMRRPLAVMMLLLICFPVSAILFIGIAAIIGSSVPLPRALRGKAESGRTS